MTPEVKNGCSIPGISRCNIILSPHSTMGVITMPLFKEGGEKEGNTPMSKVGIEQGTVVS